MWTLNEAVELISKIQPLTKNKNYHVTLGGGVLNNGQSDNDLDLYFLPLEDESEHPDDRKEHTPVDIMTIMFNITGNFGGSMGDYEHIRTTYMSKLIYMTKDNKRIDIFIV